MPQVNAQNADMSLYPRKTCELKAIAMRVRNNPHWCWYVAGWLLFTAAQAQTKTPAAPSAPPASSQNSCVIADFRRVALMYHNPQERQDKAIAWLQTNGGSCSPAQMSILISSRASLMGTADSPTLASVFDSLMEKKLGNDPAALSRYYQPVVQGPARGSAAPPAETTTAGPGQVGAAGAGATAAAGAVSTPGANMAGIAMMGQPPGMVAGTPPGAQNINFNMGGPKPPEEDMSRKLPLPTEPMFQFPPEYGPPLLNYFGKLRRQFARSFFMETLSPGKCPEGLTWRNDSCEASFKTPWRFGEKLPQGTKTYPVEPKLVEKLNFDPGYMFVRIGADILALERDTGKVADAVLNLGKAS